MTHDPMKAIRAVLDAELRKAITGPVQENRMAALRVRGTSFEAVRLGDSGVVIEPVRCACRWSAVADLDCPLHRGGVT